MLGGMGGGNVMTIVFDDDDDVGAMAGGGGMMMSGTGEGRSEGEGDTAGLCDGSIGILQNCLSLNEGMRTGYSDVISMIASICAVFGLRSEIIICMCVCV